MTIHPRLPSNPARLHPRDHLLRAATLATCCAVIGSDHEGQARRLGYADDDVTLGLHRAATSPGTLSTWGTALATSAVADFVGGLTGVSAAAALFERSLRLEFGRRGRISVPSVSPEASAAWVRELDPIPVTALDLGAEPIEPRKLAVIATLTREVLKGSNAETIVRAALNEAAARSLDAALFDDAVGDDTRPAGLLHGVSPIAAAAGDDDVAMLTDLTALVGAVGPVAGGNIVLIASPVRAMRLGIFAPGLAYPVLTSSQVPDGTLIAVAPGALAVAAGGVELDASNEATVHMSSDPDQLVESATPAAPIMSAWQVDAIMLRMILGISWTLRAAGAVALVDGAGW